MWRRCHHDIASLTTMRIRPICRIRPRIDDNPPRPENIPPPNSMPSRPAPRKPAARPPSMPGRLKKPPLAAPAAAGAPIPGLPGWVKVRFIGCAVPGAVVGAGRRGKGSRSPRTGAAAAADTGVGRRDRHHEGNRQRDDDGDGLNNSARALREIHVFFLNPRHGEAPLRWAELPKSEAVNGNHGCGPRSRGCDD